MTEPDLPTQTVELLRELIRNACVNDGSPDSGGEARNAATLERFLTAPDLDPDLAPAAGAAAGPGLSIQLLEPHPGRVSLIAELPGTDPTAPSLLLLGHTDVVPPGRGWAREPFGAEIVDGVIWGRGALDMLHLTAAYAVVIRTLARSAVRMPGKLIFAAVADEESGGHYGAQSLVAQRPDLLAVSGVLSETGGIPLASGGAVRGVTVTVGEKGMSGRRLRFEGHPRHASTPWGADNALVTAADAVSRIAAHPALAEIDDLWPQYVEALDVPPELRAALTDPLRIDAALPELGPLAGLAHAVTHTTCSPDIIRAGEKLNVVPQSAHVDLDIRTLPGVSAGAVDAYLRDALGPLADRTAIEPIGSESVASRSPLGTPLYAALAEAVDTAYPGARAVPVIAPGAADSRLFRYAGVPAYGFGMFSPRWTHADFRHLVHSVDERIDVETVGLVVRAVLQVAERVLA
ncbi:M20/M25/M40 family metallo-hydrolase [Gryllotalpicola reticulitermitis]|uniref:M20/M25/M40 family metallo-hydrolase n=1 Tax=Gryllotalpicola reticulitermitis TaxID=1184153 RepID=A0ABV8Q9M3_9MICO